MSMQNITGAVTVTYEWQDIMSKAVRELWESCKKLVWKMLPFVRGKDVKGKKDGRHGIHADFRPYPIWRRVP